MILLTKYLGGHNGVVEWMKYKAPQPWPSPMCFLRPVVPDSRYLYYLKYGTLQYTILTPICSLATVVLSTFGWYEDGVIAYNNGYPYIAFVISQSTTHSSAASQPHGAVYRLTPQRADLLSACLARCVPACGSFCSPSVSCLPDMSQVISLYCLVWLYVVMKNELMPFGPLAKFLVVKAVRDSADMHTHA